MGLDLFVPLITRIKEQEAKCAADILKGQLQPQVYNYTVGKRHGLLQALNIIDDILKEDD